MREKKRCNQLNIESANSCEGKAGVIFDMHQKNSLTNFMHAHLHTHTHRHMQTTTTKIQSQRTWKYFCSAIDFRVYCYYRQCDKIQYVCAFFELYAPLFIVHSLGHDCMLWSVEQLFDGNRHTHTHGIRTRWILHF